MSSNVAIERSAVPSLRRVFTWTFVGNAGYAACQWGMLSLLAKMGSAEMVGQFALAIAITTPIMAFSNLNLRVVQATDARSEFDFYHYLITRMLTTSAAIAATSMLVLVFGYSSEVATVIVLMMARRAVESISDILHGTFQKLERMDLVAKSLLLRGLLSLGGMAAGLLLTGQLSTALVGALIAALATLLLYNLPTATSLALGAGIRPRVGIEAITQSIQAGYNWAAIFRLLRIAAPLGVVVLLTTLSSNVPRLFVDHFLGAHELGIFAGLAYFTSAGSTVVSALGQSASPRLSRLHAAGNMDRFQKLMVQLVVLAGALGVGAGLLTFLVGDRLLTLLYTAEYADYVPLFAILNFGSAAVFATSSLVIALTAARVIQSQVAIYAVGVVVSVLLCLALVPTFDLEGAAYSVVITAVIQFVCAILIVREFVFRRSIIEDSAHDLPVPQ